MSERNLEKNIFNPDLFSGLSVILRDSGFHSTQEQKVSKNSSLQQNVCI